MGGKARVEATITQVNNGHKLTGEKRGGRWILRCPSWPDIAEQYDGCADASDAMDEFNRRAELSKGKPDDGSGEDDDGS